MCKGNKVEPATLTGKTVLNGRIQIEAEIVGRIIFRIVVLIGQAYIPFCSLFGIDFNDLCFHQHLRLKKVQTFQNFLQFIHLFHLVVNNDHAVFIGLGTEFLDQFNIAQIGYKRIKRICEIFRVNITATVNQGRHAIFAGDDLEFRFRFNQRFGRNKCRRFPFQKEAHHLFHDRFFIFCGILRRIDVINGDFDIGTLLFCCPYRFRCRKGGREQQYSTGRKQLSDRHVFYSISLRMPVWGARHPVVF